MGHADSSPWLSACGTAAGELTGFTCRQSCPSLSLRPARPRLQWWGLPPAPRYPAAGVLQSPVAEQVLEPSSLHGLQNRHAQCWLLMGSIWSTSPRSRTGWCPAALPPVGWGRAGPWHTARPLCPCSLHGTGCETAECVNTCDHSVHR